MQRVCKCHGVSGSCSSQTCWLQLPSFTTVAAALKKQYRRATKLKDTNVPAAAAPPEDVANSVDHPATVMHSVHPHRLVYLAHSPDYCRPNKTAGESLKGILVILTLTFSCNIFLSGTGGGYMYRPAHVSYCLFVAGLAGTGGRGCSRARGMGVTREERRSCRRLCRQCGLAVTRSLTSVTTSCNCRFQWCCTVHCDTCTNKVAAFTCADGSASP